MSGWQEKLDIFMSNFEYISDTVGILVCGSYITGTPTNHSDLDVHVVLDDDVQYRERGNKVVDGLLIEYFANPPKQIHRYFKEDIGDKSLMCQMQFATGKILLDKNGDVAALKEKALTMIDDFYANGNEKPIMNDNTKYFLWDMMDDLQNAHENDKPDFDFLYFNLLNRLVSNYMSCVNRPYNFKTILGNISDVEVRKKYLLRELPDEGVSVLIEKCILAIGKDAKLSAYEKLTNLIMDNFGGFQVNGFKLKSNV